MASSRPLRLVIKLDGPLLEQHRLPLSELARVTRQFHAALQGVATVLSGHGPSGRSGRVKKFIEQATDLSVVAPPRAGSFVLELEVPLQLPEQQRLSVDIGPDLGERAVESLITGLASLSDRSKTLPIGFDPGVLKAIVPFRTSIKKGVTDIGFTTARGAHSTGEARLDAERVNVAERLIKQPVRARASARGTLEMVDFRSLQCRIDRSPLPSVVCIFEEKDRDTVQSAVRQFVHVMGEGEFGPGKLEPSKICVSSISIHYEVLPFDPQAFWQTASVTKLADEKAIQPFELPASMDDDPWRDDDEAARLIAAIEQQD